MSVVATPLEVDALVQAKEYFLTLVSALSDGDISSIEKLVGFNPSWAALAYAKEYTGDSSFMKDMKARASNGMALSIPMVRAILNICRAEVRGESANKEDSRSYKCYGCGEAIVGYEPLMKHRMEECPKRNVKCELCGWVRKADEGDCGCTTGPKAIATEAESDLEISGITGYYSVPNPRAHEPEQDSFLYFRVKYRRQAGYRDRQYYYSKFRYRRELVPAGTFEVEWQRGDTKKLVGEQRPGHNYVGEFVEELKVIMSNPPLWAKLYGLQIGRCGRCNKSLTDDYSKAIGFGPDCEEIINTHGWGYRGTP